MSERTTITNRQFAASNSHFLEACERAGIKPTKRQASKFRRKAGLAYTEFRRQGNA